jgi:hypothetical protein
MPSRLRIARAIGKHEEGVAVELVAQVKRREVHDEQGEPPPFASDGLPHYRQALVEVYGEVPSYGGRGRPPSGKRPPKGLRYGQIVKQRRGGRVVGVEERIVCGEPEEVRAAWGGGR